MMDHTYIWPAVTKVDLLSRIYRGRKGKKVDSYHITFPFEALTLPESYTQFRYGDVEWDDTVVCRHIEFVDTLDAVPSEVLIDALTNAYPFPLSKDLKIFAPSTEDRSGPQLKMSASPLARLPGDKSSRKLIVTVSEESREGITKMILLRAPQQSYNLTSLLTSKAVDPFIVKVAQNLTFKPLPLPMVQDDWLAQYYVHPESFEEFQNKVDSKKDEDKRSLKIYLLPLTCSKAKHPEQVDFEHVKQRLHEYIQSFFAGVDVEMLPDKEITVNGRGYAMEYNTSIGFRTHCMANDTKQRHGQLCATDLLTAISPRYTRTGPIPGSGAKPADGYCVLAFTLVDIYSGDDDEFTGGLATPDKGVGIFSFYRNALKLVDLFEKNSALIMEHLTVQGAKTAIHEIIHMYNVPHCVFAACLMQGCGHTAEGIETPDALCPVCLAKLKYSLNAFNVAQHASNMASFTAGSSVVSMYDKSHWVNMAKTA